MGEPVSKFCEAVNNRQLNRVGVKWEKKYNYVDLQQRDSSGCKDIYEIWMLWV